MAEQFDLTDFHDFYNALDCDADADLETIKKNYRKLILDWHPDKRPNSATHTGTRMFQLINDAWDTLKDAEKRGEYKVLWREYQKQKLMPFERAELARKEGNEYYKKGQVAAKENNIPQALQMYTLAIEKYSDGIDVGTSDHRLHSNRALCYAVLRDWHRAKKDAHQVVKLRENFMKGWFTLVRAYIMEGNIEAAQSQLEKGLANCDNHPDLRKLQEEIDQKKQEQKESIPRQKGDRNGQTMPSGSLANDRPLSYRDVTPSRTPPTPILRAGQSGGLRPVRGWGVDLEATGQFGRNAPPPGPLPYNPDLDGTANFGRSIGYSRTPPRRASPGPGGIPGMLPLRGNMTPPRDPSIGGMPGRGRKSLNATIDFGSANPMSQSYTNFNQTMGSNPSYAYPYQAAAASRGRSKTPQRDATSPPIPTGPVRAPSLANQAQKIRSSNNTPRQL